MKLAINKFWFYYFDFLICLAFENYGNSKQYIKWCYSLPIRLYFQFSFDFEFEFFGGKKVSPSESRVYSYHRPPPPSKTKKETPRVLLFMILLISHATECLTLKIEVGSNKINWKIKVNDFLIYLFSKKRKKKGGRRI